MCSKAKRGLGTCIGLGVHCLWIAAVAPQAAGAGARSPIRAGRGGRAWGCAPHLGVCTSLGCNRLSSSSSGSSSSSTCSENGWDSPRPGNRRPGPRAADVCHRLVRAPAHFPALLSRAHAGFPTGALLTARARGPGFAPCAKRWSGSEPPCRTQARRVRLRGPASGRAPRLLAIEQRHQGAGDGRPAH